MLLVAGSGIDHVAYILILYSLAFLMFLFVNMLVSLYDRTANAELLAAKNKQRQSADAAEAAAIRLNGNARAENRQVHDAEEFELGELMSEDEEDEEQSARRTLLKQEGLNHDDDEEAGTTLMNGNGQAHRS